MDVAHELASTLTELVADARMHALIGHRRGGLDAGCSVRASTGLGRRLEQSSPSLFPQSLQGFAASCVGLVMNKLNALLGLLALSTGCASHNPAEPDMGSDAGSDMGSDIGSDMGSNAGSADGLTVDQVLATGGDFVAPPPAHGEEPIGPVGDTTLAYQDNTQWDCATQQVSVQEDPQEVVTLNPSADVIYPGALVQGNSLDSGNPEPIPVRRGGGTIVLSIVNGTGAPYQQQVTEATEGNITDAQNHLLSGITDTAIPANFVMDYSMYDSLDKFAMDIGVDVSWLSGDIKTQVDFSTSTHQTHAVLRLTQQYFTTTFQTPTSTADFFAPDLAGSELAPFVGAGNPAGYISEVTYGRQFYLVFDSTASTEELKAAVDAVYHGAVVNGSASMSSDLLQTQKQTTVHVIAIGGAADAALSAAAAAPNSDPSAGLFVQLQKYITSGSTFSPQNPGLPISYTVRDVVHRNIVTINVADQYTTTKCSQLATDELAMSLDANKASYANGLMTAWPGDTTAANQPTAGLSTIAKGNVVNGMTWALMSPSSAATGIDCGWANSGAYTIISVSNPTSAVNGYLISANQEQLLGPVNYFMGWGYGWSSSGEFLNGRTLANGWYGTNWSVAPQPGGEVSSLSFLSGTGSHAWANGVALPLNGGDGEGNPGSIANCAIGSTNGDYGPGFTGQVGEIRAYRGVLTDSQRELVECELGAKWGIGVDGCTNGRPNDSY